MSIFQDLVCGPIFLTIFNAIIYDWPIRFLPFPIIDNPSKSLHFLPPSNIQGNTLLKMALVPYLCLSTYTSCCK
ncbi:hypothetical protein PISMIDRAFT_273963 [Pisolithus microcarpus 441]|uniref:Uncharacterized protein n=1 Tax=Pisolithus microcarpus 441 TaxID=765257 RepID=A0A0C9YMY9_9AGAM|nr:hypothetical protein BKA83DRAFT_273963 [Pisolithus microcarpus]KIK26365.1 hypothetical protein PISMIDRAFT_273963 [Pisolithus microcarpus 441]